MIFCKGERLKNFAALGSFIFLSAVLPAQDRGLEMLPGLRRRAIVVTINSGIAEQNQEVAWNETVSKMTLPGRQVGLKLVGQNIIVVAQFTPYIRRNGESVLAAQGQVWIEVPDEGIHYQTTMQVIPFEFGEKILFFPLGSGRDDRNASIVIEIELSPYEEEESDVPLEVTDQEQAGDRGSASERQPPESSQ
jgi:hypothetical protein